MRTTIQKIYHCEHCKKHMLSAASMSRHEKYCRRNPVNMHKCFDMCSFLKRNTELIEGKSPCINSSYRTVFMCLKTYKRMFSYLAEKKATSYFGCPMKYDDLIRMPLHCKDHQYMSDNEIEKRFGINQDEF